MLRIHASFHKCLTVYYLRIMERLYNWKRRKTRYKHLEALQDEFYATAHRYRVVSTSGFAIDTSRLDGDYRIVRFVRDPRDLVVSGYHYHRRGAEPWFRKTSPTDEDWKPIAGRVPAGMSSGVSYAEYLESIDLEQGLRAEIEFRAEHFESLRHWKDDPRVRLFKYEEILGNEAEVFDEIGSFYELPFYERKALVWLARRFAAGRQHPQRHIRDPSPGQWREVFPPALAAEFNERYADVLDRLGY